MHEKDEKDVKDERIYEFSFEIHDCSEFEDIQNIQGIQGIQGILPIQGTLPIQSIDVRCEYDGCEPGECGHIVLQAKTHDGMNINMQYEKVIVFQPTNYIETERNGCCVIVDDDRPTVTRTHILVSIEKDNKKSTIMRQMIDWGEGDEDKEIEEVKPIVDMEIDMEDINKIQDLLLRIIKKSDLEQTREANEEENNPDHEERLARFWYLQVIPQILYDTLEFC